MPRVLEPRPPAVPTTDLQKERCTRILREAARLGARLGIEHIQLSEIARNAGVAVGTLYRYYPSKYHLFAGVLTSQVSTLEQSDYLTGDPRLDVAEFMARACREMLARPLLARAMLTSMNAVHAESQETPAFDLRPTILKVAGIEEPSTEDERLARLVEQSTFGILTWAVMGQTSPGQAEADVRRACSLLLAPWS